MHAPGFMSWLNQAEQQRNSVATAAKHSSYACISRNRISASVVSKGTAMMFDEQETRDLTDGQLTSSWEMC